jgi:dolichyl-phosphate-mannose-protein mannosyltransferase
MRNWLQRARARPEILGLTVVSAVLHFWRLLTPNAVVFDEMYYEHFAGYYLDGAYMFDVHPPLGRMMYAGLAYLLGIPGSALQAGVPEPMLRILPAAFGTAIVPLVYLMLRQLRASRKVATLAAAALVMENCLLVDSRLSMIDIFLIGFGLLAMTSYLAARRREGSRRTAFLVATAFFGGCALTVKWTGASALGLVLGAWYLECYKTRIALKPFLREGAMLVGLPVLIYLGAFAVHFAALPRTGPGAGFMSTRFRRQLPGNPQFNPAEPKMGYWKKFGEVHRAIRYANGSLENVTHPGASRWYTWPIMKHPIGLWEGKVPPGYKAMIDLLGNPIVWWGGMIGVLGGIVLFLVRRARFAGYEYGFLFLLGGVAINYVPFMGIKRLMYLYHYLFALVIVVACAAYAAGVAAGWMREDDGAWRFPSRRSAALYWGLLGLIFASFLYFLPLTYGFTQTLAAFDQRFWVLHPTF